MTKSPSYRQAGNHQIISKLTISNDQKDWEIGDWSLFDHWLLVIGN
jgi:hypothetical protein